MLTPIVDFKSTRFAETILNELWHRGYRNVWCRLIDRIIDPLKSVRMESCWIEKSEWRS